MRRTCLYPCFVFLIGLIPASLHAAEAPPPERPGGAWTGTASNASVGKSDGVTLVLATIDGQQVRALGGFDSKALFGRIDTQGRAVPCAETAPAVAERCYAFDGTLVLGDDGSGFPSGTRAGFHLRLRVPGDSAGAASGDYRIDPIPEHHPEPQVGTLDLAKALTEPAASLQLAWSLHQAGEHEPAFAIEARLITADPQNADLYWQRAQWSIILKHEAAAIPDLRKVTELASQFADAWGNLGWFLILQGQWAEAQAAARKAQELAPDSYAFTVNLGHTYLLQGERDKAHVWYEKAVPLIPDAEALTSGPLTDFDLFIERGWQVESSRAERAWFETAAREAIAANQRAAEQHQRADAYWAEGQAQQKAGQALAAAQRYRQAAEAEQVSGRPRLNNLAAELSQAAVSYEKAGRYAEAEPLFREALDIRRQALPAGLPDIATSLNNLAQLLKTTGCYGEAEPLYREALDIYRVALPAGNPDIATVLNNLAELLRTTGRYGEAEPLYREALDIYRVALPAGNPDIATSLNNLALLLKTTGRYGESEPIYREALDMRHKTLPAGHPDIAQSLHNLAALLKTTGRYGEAETLYREALEIGRKTLPAGHPNIAVTLNNLAVLLKTTGRYGEAEPIYREALEIRRKALPAGHPNIANSLNNLAGLLAITGRNKEAEPLYREALEIRRQALPAGHPDIAMSLSNLAGLLETTGRSGEAEPLIQEALVIARQGGAPEVLWNVQGHLTSLYAAHSQRPLAIFYGKQAVNTIQAVRQNLRSAEQATQQTFMKSKEAYYKTLSDLLIADGRLPEAQQVLEMLKEQEYFDFLNRDAQADPRQTLATLNPFESEQAARIETVAAPLRASYQEAETLRRIHESVRTPDQVQRLKTLEDTLSQGQQALKVAFDQVQAAFAALTAERQRQLTGQLHFSGDLRELVGTLGQGVALVQYLVLEDQLRILVTTPKGITPYQVPLKAADLNQAAFQFYRLLANPQRDPRPAGQGLYDSLIAPLAPQLRQDGIHTLMFALDGILRYLPLAALYDGQHYLSEDYALAIYTAAARDGLAARAPGQWEAVGLGVSEEHPGFSALPAVRAEIAGIIKRDPQDTAGVLPGAMFLDQAFTRDTLRASLAHGYPVVHLASHFAFRPGNEQQSFLLLGDGSHLDLGTLRTGGYPFTGVDLLTLSACDTALDSPGAKGQEIEGFGTLAQKQGAKGVIATLWPVNDASTGRFMQDFYRLRQERHLSKAEALRQAQLTLLRGPRDSETTAEKGPRRPASWGEETAATGKAATLPSDPAHPYAHPYYWAPFILMGNWL